MPARHTDSASVWGFTIYPASQRVQEHGPLCGLAIGTPPGGPGMHLRTVLKRPQRSPAR
jgi:hypothetical protein